MSELIQTSFYQLYRPTMVVFFFLGQFPVKRVFVNDSKDLRHSLFSISNLILISYSCFTYIPVKRLFLKGNGFLLTIRHLHFVFTSMFLLWFSINCKKLVKAFNVLDLMRNFSNVLPHNIRAEPSQPPISSRVSCALFILFLGIFSFFISAFVIRNTSFDLIIFVVTYWFYPLRQFLILSLLFFSSSLVIKDTLKSWRLFCSLNCRPLSNLQNFCQLMMGQISCLEELEECLGDCVRMVLTHRVFWHISTTFFRISYTHHVTSNIVDLFTWGFFISVLTASACCTRHQVNCGF